MSSCHFYIMFHCRDSTGKRLIDYLFLVFDRKAVQQSDTLKLLEEGFGGLENFQVRHLKI